MMLLMWDRVGESNMWCRASDVGGVCWFVMNFFVCLEEKIVP
jgi:hypothetical protein